MTPILLVCLFGAFIPIVNLPAPQNTVYVGPSGSDSIGTGTSGNPWASPAHACASIIHTQDTTIRLLAGTYLGVSWTIGIGCSGSPGHPLTIIADGGINTVDLIGGQQVNAAGCTVYSGSVYKCPVPGSANFWTAFEGGARLQWARTPNISINPTYPASFEPTFLTTGGTYTTFTYTGTDFDPSTWTIGDVSVFLWAGGAGIETNMQWFSGQNIVTSINTGTHTVTVGQNFKYSSSGGGTGYVMMGDLAMLDQQGEWYLDRNDVHGAAPGGQHYFYVYPTATPISGETFLYPTTSDVLTIAGTDQAHPVHDIVVQNIGVEVSDFTSLYRYASWGTGAGSDYDNTVCNPSPNPWPGDCGMQLERAEPNVRHALVHISNAQNITDRPRSPAQRRDEGRLLRAALRERVRY